MLSPRVRLTLMVIGTLALAAIAGVLAFAAGERTAETSAFRGALRPPGIAVADFGGLRDQDGRRVRLAQMRGRPVVVTFLYAACRDACPLTAAQIRGALDDLGHDVPVIAVSVDPAGDTPRAARAFALRQKMSGRMRWVLGDRAALQRIWRSYGIRPQSARFEHSSSTVLLDARGRQRIGFLTEHLTPESLAHDLRRLEAEAR